MATRGPEEVVVFDGETWFTQAPRPIVPKDTLGAGDAFITQFLLSYVGGLKTIDKTRLIAESL